MKIIRYQDSNGNIGFAQYAPAGNPKVIRGNADAWEVTGEPADVARLLAPVDARAIIGIGLNYRAHAEETGKELPQHPMVFLKMPGAVQDPGAPIVLPRHLPSREVDFEGELAVVIGRKAKNVPPEEALHYVLGYTCANDVSARDWQFKLGGGQFSRAKTFDTFCPLGPCLVTVDEAVDPTRFQLKTFLNGELMQDTSVADLIFSIPELIAFLSGSTTLLPGTVILTGTPSGVGWTRKPPRYLEAGDSVDVEIEGIGRLTNPVIEEKA
ncbi:MAG: fumarylacetoacetate hydrolase family protein [Opitutales bacterium]